ncbi:unnamed protein product [Ilex paraguariensis]|uniref:Uncharacterized protein n=1 Tax=Ilex paraguariensis TaxID=185542 RepID=A0ABC8SEM2_9AQUA
MIWGFFFVLNRRTKSTNTTKPQQHQGLRPLLDIDCDQRHQPLRSVTREGSSTTTSNLRQRSITATNNLQLRSANPANPDCNQPLRPTIFDCDQQTQIAINDSNEPSELRRHLLPLR